MNPHNLHDVKVGDILFAVRHSGLGNREVTVSKVGRDYLYLRDERGWKVDRETGTLREGREYTIGRVYASKAVYLAQVYSQQLRFRVRAIESLRLTDAQAEHILRCVDRPEAMIMADYVLNAIAQSGCSCEVPATSAPETKCLRCQAWFALAGGGPVADELREDLDALRRTE